MFLHCWDKGLEVLRGEKAVLKSVSSKVAKYEKMCFDNHVYIPFVFDNFDFLTLKTMSLLPKVQRLVYINIVSHKYNF